MDFKNFTTKLKTSDSLKLPLNQTRKQIIIDPNEFKNSEVELLCYRIHLISTNSEAFVYIFKNVEPTGHCYHKSIREGDRLINFNGQDMTHLSHEHIYTLIIENKNPFTCEVVWHPELYIDLEISRVQLERYMEQLDYEKFISNKTYEQIACGLKYLFNQRPKEPYYFFEGFAKRSNENELKLSVDEENKSYLFTQRQIALLSNSYTIPGNPNETMANILELDFLFQQVGVGLNKEEIYWIWILMKDLLSNTPTIQKLNFWGKIFGIKNNYYIVEADFDTFDDIDLADSEFVKYQSQFSYEEEEEENSTLDSVRKSVPPELVGDGANQKIFYVSTGIDQSFVQLPMVTPEQIELSRRIQQFFTGDLDAPVLCTFNFPGVEKHLLRAQIQRITATTQIGPKNYYKISTNEEEELGEETTDLHQNRFDINTEFEGNKLEDLVLPQGFYWVHYAAYIHKQGRNMYFNQLSQYEKSTKKNMSKEYSPNLLSTINQDTLINGLYPAWSIGISSRIIPEHSMVYVRSNRWPGACTVGDRYRFKNIYIGWGVKTFLETHQANMIDVLPENEYDLQLIEIDDPTVEEDNELFRSAMLLSPNDDEEFHDEIEY